MAVTPISRCDSEGFEDLFEESTIVDAWSDFEDKFNQRILFINHRDKYTVRFLGPMIAVQRYNLEKRSPISARLNTAEIRKLISGTMPESEVDQIVKSRRSVSGPNRIRTAIERIQDPDRWDKCIMGNVLVRKAKDKNLVGKIKIHSLTETDIGQMSGSDVRRRNVTGINAYDVSIHNVGSGTSLLSPSELNDEEVRKVLRQGLYDLAVFIRESNQSTARNKSGYFYKKVNSACKLADSYMKNFREAIVVTEEDKEVDYLDDHPEVLFDTYQEELPIISMIDIG